MSRFRARLELVTNLSLTAASVAVVAFLGLRLLGGGAPSAPPRAQAYQRGEVLPVLAGVDYRSSQRTLIVVIATTCRFCRDDVPVYSRLSSLRHKGRFQLIVAGLETTDVLSAFSKAHGVDADGIVSITHGTLRVAGTPTLILVDNQSRVLAVWRGRLGSRESEVFAAVES